MTRLSPDAPAFAVTGRNPAGAATRGTRRTLDIVYLAAGTAICRLGGQLRLPGARHRVRIVRTADDRARKSCLVGSAFVCAPVDSFGHRLPCGHPYRGCHLSSLCAPRWCPHAHGYRLTARWLEDGRCQNAAVVRG